MSLSYSDSDALISDTGFRGRIKIACLHYASYRGKGAWATSTIQSPDNAAQVIQPIVVMDANVQSQGAAISDNDLQTVVETVVNNML